MNDQQELHDLNAKITEAENEGNCEWLAGILAPRLAFQRADPKRTVDDQIAFLQKVKKVEKPEEARRTVSIGPIEVHGSLAVVQHVVAVGDKQYRNLRLFVKREGGWKLLGWANEQL